MRSTEELLASVNGGGTWRRRRAARRLAAMRSPLAVGAAARVYAASADEQVREILHAALSTLDDQEQVDAVCDAATSTEGDRLPALIVQAGYTPSNPGTRAVLLFLAGEFERYAELDFDGDLLLAAHAAADAGLRARLAERARSSGRTEWARAVTAGRHGGNLAELSGAEWHTVVTVLTGAGNWDELWRLAGQAPPVRSVPILRELGKHDWRPVPAIEAAGFRSLVALALACPPEIPAGVMLEQAGALEHPGTVVKPLVTRDGSLLVVDCGEGRIRVWTLPGGTPAGGWSVPKDPQRSLEVAITPDGSLLVTSDNKTIRLWRLPSGEPAGVLKGHDGSVRVLAVSADSRLLASGANDGTIRLWRLPSGEPIRTLSGGGGFVIRLEISPDNQILASGTMGGPNRQSGELRFWSLPSGRLIGKHTPATWSVGELAMHPDGSLMASADKQLRVWRLPGGTPVTTAPAKFGDVRDMVVTPDGSLLVSGRSDGTVRLWRLPSGEPSGVLRGHSGFVWSVAVSADGRLAASLADDKQLRLWRLPSGEPAAAVSVPDAAAVFGIVALPRGDMFTTSGGNTVRLWRSCLDRMVSLPPERIGPADLDALKAALGSLAEGERAWAELTIELTLWRRRYDIEIESRPEAASTDIEVGE